MRRATNSTALQRLFASQVRDEQWEGDAEKVRYWQRMIRKAVQSGMPLREFAGR